MNKILIIGASNIDYFGMVKDNLVMNDSNKGIIRISFGGVGRNVCENLARLGVDITFITVIGNDEMGRVLLNQLNELKVTVIVPNDIQSSSSYMAIHDNTGDMVLAINDMDNFKKINIDFIEKNYNIIDAYDYIVCDGNVSLEAIDYIFKTFKNKKILVDGISTTKVMKFINHLNEIYLLKCNIYEAQALIKKPKVEAELLSELLSLGCKRVVVTNGVKDIYYSDGVQIYSTPVTPAKDIINATGAGDAMFSGIVFQLLNEASVQEGVEFGKRLATLTLSSIRSVSEEVSSLLRS